MVSNHMSDFFYRQARDMLKDEDSPSEVGTKPIGLNIAALLLGLFLLWHLLAWGWILSGGTVWKGYKETAITAHTGWTATPFSAPAVDNGLELNLPLFARQGEELVVAYQHDSDVTVADGTFPVRVYVHCFLGCTSKDAQRMTANAPGTGELSVLLPRTSLYHVRIVQTSKHDGSTSRGIFWWGTRSPKMEREAP